MVWLDLTQPGFVLVDWAWLDMALFCFALRYRNIYTYIIYIGKGQPLGAAEAHVPPAVRVDQLENQRGFRRSIRHGGRCGGEGG